MAESPNRPLLEKVAHDLGELVANVVFVGGQITELLISNDAVVRIRPTTDVDVVVSAATRTDYHELEMNLRQIGFTNDRREGAPICRWISPSGGVLDLMPIDERVLGFANPWYGHAVVNTVEFELGNGIVIRHPTAPVFLATKLAAYRSRGEGDLYGSHDLEDVISLVAGRPELGDELAHEPKEVRHWLREEFAELLINPDFPFAIQGALPDVGQIPGYLEQVIETFRKMARVDEGSAGQEGFSYREVR